jgi:hypothetical protein
MKAAVKNDFLAPRPSAIDAYYEEQQIRDVKAYMAAKAGARAMVDLGPSRRYPIYFSPNRGGGGSRTSNGFDVTPIGSENALGQTGSMGFRWYGDEVTWADNIFNETSGSVVIVPQQIGTDIGNAAGSFLRETFNPAPDPVIIVNCSTATGEVTDAVPGTPITSGFGANGAPLSTTQGSTVIGGGGLFQAGAASISSVPTGVNNNGVSTQGNSSFRGRITITIRPP